MTTVLLPSFVDFGIDTTGTAQQTRMYRADLGGLGLNEIISITLRDSDSGVGGSTGIYSGFDLDAIFLDGDGLLSTADDRIYASEFYFLAGDIRPGSYAPPSSSGGPTSGSTSAVGIDEAFATLNAIDAIWFGTGSLTLGDGGSLTSVFDPGVSIGSSLYLFVGEVSGDAGETLDGLVEIADVSDIGINDIGTDGNDFMPGTEFQDTLSGLAGNDTLAGGGGDDVLLGGDGDDLAYSASGADRLNGGIGDDTLYGGTGNDTLNGEAGNDLLGGGGGNDSLDGGDGNDAIWTGAGNDTAQGGTDADTLGGAGGDDSLAGGAGNDEIWGSTGNDTLEGGNGDDLMGGFDGNDSLDGGDGNDELWGASGMDTALGGAGADQIGGGTDNDYVDGGSGNDSLYGGLGDDTVLGGLGDDLIYGAAGNDSLDGGAGNDTIYAGPGNDTVVYSDGADELQFFSASEDRLELDDALWTGTLTAAQVVNTFGSTVGSDFVLDFGGGDSVTLVGLGGVIGLESQIDIV